MRTWLRRVLVPALALLTWSAGAEDIDIFAAKNGANDLPNVLLIWDSSANWSSNIPVPACSYSDGSGGPKSSNPNSEQGTKMAIEKCAIYNAIDGLAVASDGSALFNVGLMLFNESGSPQGGYPRKQFLPMTAANKTALKNIIRNIGINSDKANNAPYVQALYEAYLMFSKQTPYNGTQGSKWDATAVTGGKYAGPPGSGCVNHIVVISNGSPTENNTNALALLQAVNADTTALQYPASYITNSDQNNWADEFARFLRSADVNSRAGLQAVTTHVIAVTGAPGDNLYPNFMRAVAQQGAGQFYQASTAAQLSGALRSIFTAVQAVNSVFASASLPISVNLQGTYENQVFIGMFRPDGQSRPRWPGNLKQYSMAYDQTTDTLSLVDSTDRAAINAATGFFVPHAISEWTTASSFWVNNPMGTPQSASDRPDGDIVEKGAVAQGLRTKYAQSRAGRPVFTCLSCAPGTILASSSAASFVDTNSLITSTTLGAADATERAQIINWVRGDDNNNDELGPGGGSTVRPSIHGDVLHSRPVVVDYGGSTGTIVYYGANDGMLHAIDGNRAGKTATAGQELWAFLPSEFFGRFKRLRDNSPNVLFPSTPAGSNAAKRDYFVDGALTVYQKRNVDRSVNQVIIYVSMRRGGRMLYAFDVTQPTNPRLLWRKTNADYGVLGQTWSDPSVTRLRGYANPVLVMGAGYDAAAEDVIPPQPPTMGNAVLVLDALDGSLVKSFATARSVIAGVALLDSDYDGYTDRGYAVDTGANVYRLDFEPGSGDADSTTWRISTLATLGDSVGSRKFFYTPDVVQTKGFTAVLMGSGNREQPLLATSNDRFYTIVDYKVSKGAPSGAPITEGSLGPVGGSLPAGVAGCYMNLDTAGEKVVTGAVSTGGYTYFSTNKPNNAANTCAANLGTATTYRVPLFCGQAASIELVGGGLPPTPVVGMVDVVVQSLTPGAPSTHKQVPFIIGGFNAELSALAVSRVQVKVDPTRKRTFWMTSGSR